MDEQTGSVLTEYVYQGGQLVVGCRAGYKDKTGKCPMRPMPGPLADLCGIRVDDFTLIGPFDSPPRIEWSKGIDAPATTANGFNDILTVTSAASEILAIYKDDYYSNTPALG